MQCTEEQYKKDLKKELKLLGYEEAGTSVDKSSISILCTLISGVKGNNVGMLHCGATVQTRHHIKTYNPKLFLALAAMTSEEYGVVGEYIYSREATCSYSIGEIFKISKVFDTGHVVGEGKPQFEGNGRIYGLRKATKEELVTLFDAATTDKKMKEEITVTRKELEQIHIVACSTWKTKIESYANRTPFNDTVVLSSSEVATMFSAADSMQKIVLESIFGKQAEEINLHSGKVDGLEIYKVGGGIGDSLMAPSGRYNDIVWLNDNYAWELKGHLLYVKRK